MLVLSRHRGEEIVIGHHAEISITVIDIRGDKVRIGIDAARDTPVHRREVYEAIARELRDKQDEQPDIIEPDEP